MKYTFFIPLAILVILNITGVQLSKYPNPWSTRTPGMRQEDPDGATSMSWEFAAQREELNPIHYLDEELTFENQSTMVLAGNGKKYVNGHWYRFTGVEPGNYYEFITHYQTDRIEEPFRCVLARILWYDQEGSQLGPAEYPAVARDETVPRWNTIRQTYLVPERAVRAKIELIYRWDADGIVHFGGSAMKKVKPPLARKVRLATIYFRPEGTASSAENLKQFTPLIDEAGQQRADIVCLPEGITLVGTPLNYVSASEPVPGPTTRYLGNLARKHHMYMVAGILERDGEAVYNTAILIDRNGELAGKYRKLSLPREEIEGGVTPGNDLPVFDTDFGRIGMMICWDVTFPETARALAMKGAEVIFLPIWGGNLILAKARAIENQVYLVSSTYDMKSAIFDLEGDILKEATRQNPVIVSEVDLNLQKIWPWLGDFKNRIPREMPSQKAFNSDNQ
jgi:predicted amidohydrolase